MKIVFSFLCVLMFARSVVGQACPPPNYAACSYIGTDVKGYSGTQNVPPLLNQSFTDPTFNRKIWRITDTTTWNGQSTSVPWLAGYAGVFNTTMTLLQLGTNDGSVVMLSANLSNPNAPSVVPTACSYTDAPFGTCSGGKIIPNAGTGNSAVSFSGISQYVLWQLSGSATDGNGSLVKLDFSNTISSGGSTAPTRTTVFNPFTGGHCMNGVTPAQGFIRMDPTDTYFWGMLDSTSKKQAFYKSGADCKEVDSSVSPWVVSGDSTWGGPTGAVTTVNTSGATIADFPACAMHGTTYDPTANIIWMDANVGCLAGIDQAFLNLSTLKLVVCATTDICGNSGHTFGVTSNGTDTGIVHIAFDFGSTDHFYFIKSSAPQPPLLTGTITPALGSPGAYLDYHPNGAWNAAGFPLLGAFGFFNFNSAFDPPLSSMTVSMPYEGEMIVYRADDLSGNTMKLYRFVHNYSAAGDYNSGSGKYSWGVHTAFSPDHKWMIWSSNWLGNLGDSTQTPATTPCVFATRQNCRSDIFMTYLGQETLRGTPTKAITLAMMEKP